MLDEAVALQDEKIEESVQVGCVSNNSLKILQSAATRFC